MMTSVMMKGIEAGTLSPGSLAVGEEAGVGVEEIETIGTMATTGDMHMPSQEPGDHPCVTLL